MGLVAGVVDNGNAATLSAAAGQRIICVAWNRSGATTFGVTPNAGSGTWVNRLVEATLPGDDAARRSLAVAELLVASTVSAVSFTAAWNIGDTDALWMVVEEGSGYDFADVTVADSGTNLVSSLTTDSTLDITTGDVLAIAALASRDGDTGNVTWSTTDVNPSLVGGGSILLDHYGGVGTGGGNAGAAGYLAATSQPEQAYADTVTLPGAGAQTRHLTAALLVWSTGEAVPSTTPTKVADRGSAENLTSSQSTAVDLPAGSSITVGNVLIARLAMDNTGGGGQATAVTISDPRGNTWTVGEAANRDPGAASAGISCRIAYCVVENAYSDGDDLTVNFGNNTVADSTVVEEWENIDPVAPVAVAQVVNNGGSATPSVTITPTAPDQLTYCAIAIEGPAGDTYTQDSDTTNGAWSGLTSLSTTSGTAVSNATVRGASKLVTAAGDQTWNPGITNRDWAAVAIVFAPAVQEDVDFSVALPIADDAQGNLAVARPLSSSLGSAGEMAGNLTVARSFSCLLPSANSLQAFLDRNRLLSCSLSSASGLSGSLSIVRALSGNLPSAGDLVGDLTVGTVGAVDFSATSPGASDMTGSLSTVLALVGNLPSASGLTGDLAVGTVNVVDFSASLPIAGSMTMALTRLRSMSASMPNASGLAGNLGTGATSIAELTGTALVLGLAGTASVVGLSGGVTVKGLAGTVT